MTVKSNFFEGVAVKSTMTQNTENFFVCLVLSTLVASVFNSSLDVARQKDLVQFFSFEDICPADGYKKEVGCFTWRNIHLASLFIAAVSMFTLTAYVIFNIFFNLQKLALSYAVVFVLTWFSKNSECIRFWSTQQEC